MRENANTVLYIVRHNPLFLSGLGLVAVFLLLAYIKFKLKDSGYGTAPLFFHPRDWELPADYLKVQSKYGWVTMACVPDLAVSRRWLISLLLGLWQ